MAQVIPFTGILYNPAKITAIAEVTAPPYDVISPEYQDDLHQRHPNNIVRLILAKDRPEDKDETDRHRRVGETYTRWRSQEVLIRDDRPAFYLQETEYSQDDTPRKRFGLIARVRLETFDKGIVLPHEKTFSKVKSERLGLMRHCHANFSPIFSLYADGVGDGGRSIIGTLRKAAEEAAPLTAMTDDQGHQHRVHRLVDPAVLDSITAAFSDERLYIADGHHRYETALNYRDWLAANDPGFDPAHPANYVLMYLASMEDPGMLILPAHRLLHQVPPEAVDRMLAAAEAHFDIETFAAHGTADEQFRDRLRSLSESNAIGLARKGRSELTVLRLKPQVMSRRYGQEMATELQDLDVSVLTRLIFMDLLGFDQARLDNNQLIGYSSTIPAALTAVRSGTYDAAFILNPTRMSQVRRVSEAGLVMPRKSTYFYPKVTSGLVLNSLLKGE